MRALSDSKARSVHGSLQLRAAVDAVGITRLVEARRCGPMQLQRPLYLDAQRSGLATVYLVNATAGLFEGDALSTQIDVEHDAALELRTPTMARVYSMNDGQATSSVEMHVQCCGYLEYLPGPTLLCAGAALRQRTRVELAPDAQAAIGEVWSFGRTAHGEAHAYHALSATVDIRLAARPIVREQLQLRPSEGIVRIAVADRSAYATLTLIGRGADRQMLAGARDSLDAAEDVIGGASMLADEAGIAVRALGDSASTLLDVFLAIVRRFRDAARLPDRESALVSESVQTRGVVR